MTWSELSKAVGNSPRILYYPTIECVRTAIEYGEWARILEWYRFLPTPCNDTEEAVLELIVEGFFQGRKLLG